MVDWDTIYLALGLKVMLAIIIIAEMMMVMMEMMMMMMEAPSPRQPRWSSRRARWSRRGTRRVLRSKLSQLGIGNIFLFFSSYILFSLFSSLYSWDLKLFFTLSQKLFPSIVRLHKWEIRSEDSSKLRFQIATFLRFSCQNLQSAKGLEEVNSMTICIQPQTFFPVFYCDGTLKFGNLQIPSFTFAGALSLLWI